MATQVKLTAARGAQRLKDVTVTAGTPIAGGDAIEINIDVTRMTKEEAFELIEKARQRIFAAKWPMT